MYCKKCGNQLNTDAKFCPKCGKKILNEDELSSKKTIKLEDTDFSQQKSQSAIVNDENIEGTNSENYDEKIHTYNKYNNSQEEKYLFLQKVDSEKRAILNNRLVLGKKIIEWIIKFLTVYFIYEQIQLAENYKLIIYFIRYIIYILPFVFFEELYSEFYKLITLQENQSNKSSVTKIIVCKVISILLYIFIINSLTNPTEDSIGLLHIIVQDNFLSSLIKYLFFIKFEILSLIILGISNQYIDKKILGYKEESKD